MNRLSAARPWRIDIVEAEHPDAGDDLGDRGAETGQLPKARERSVGVPAGRVLLSRSMSPGGAHLDRIEERRRFRRLRSAMSPSLPLRGKCDVRNTSGPLRRPAQGVRASECLPHRVGAEHAAAHARERARHVEVPLDVVGVLRDEVDRDACASGRRGFLATMLNPASSSRSFGERLRGLALLDRARLEARRRSRARRGRARASARSTSGSGRPSSRTRSRAMST